MNAFDGFKGHVIDYFFCVKSSMGREDHIGKRTKNRHLGIGDHIPHSVCIVKSCLILQYIQGGLSYSSTFQCFYESVSVDQSTSGSVDDDHAVLHKGKCLFIEHVMIFLGRGGMEGDDIAFFVQFFQAYIGYLVSFLFRIQIITWEKVIGQNFAAKALQMLYYGAPDLTGADDTNSTVTQILSIFPFKV